MKAVLREIDGICGAAKGYDKSFFSGYHSIPPEVLCYIQYSIKIANLQVLLTKYYYKCRIKVIIHWLHSALLCMVGPAANYHTIYCGKYR